MKLIWIRKHATKIQTQDASDDKNSIMFPSFPELTEGKHQLVIQTQKLIVTDKEAAKQYMKQFTEDVCHDLSHYCNFLSLGRLNCLNV